MVTRRQVLLGALAGPAAVPGLDRAVALLEAATASGQVAAAVLHVSVGKQDVVRAFGQARPDTVFLLASLTKPMTAAAVMTLVERGRLALDQPASKHLPELVGGGRERITLRHLLDHTSGLPDMLPDNLALRQRHAPLRDFVRGALAAPLSFAPGTARRYQSMGFLLAAEMVERITARPFREHMQRSLFRPLGMTGASLGLGGRRVQDTARCQVPDDEAGWNSPYWRDLGSPWGGAHGRSADLIRLLRWFARPRGRPLRAATARAMLTPSPPVPVSGQGKTQYGLGWRLAPAPGLASGRFGHSGATGVDCWMDPARDLAFVLLTTLPAAQSEATVLKPISDLIAAPV